ncbi:betaine-aldehyde dehydrogenase [Zooshikella ganghwensis]|uniref:Betaine-aldehyde dehydrogenase n=1 Tax=Zooshikella ganghwensis TaxID=202772 RepID=A0A4P9VKV0_9GAMM|nr:betaine-aldehyde dehydrogenase [Zooshikella ganghwensis]RDH43883.1 betaine-aldehyde dehydrogenase [Zooshikella ganghwensis]
MSLPLYRSFINGEYISNTTGETFPVVNPATGDVIYEVEQADNSLITAAVQSAEAGFIKWSSLSGMERSRVLIKAAQLLRQRNDELAKIEVIDTGKPWQEASTVDIQTGADSIEYYAGLAASALTGQQQSIGNDFYYTRREPLGICAGIGAWNYPLQIACWKAGPALACGNSMIFKPSEETPLGALKLAEIFIEAGLPPGVFNVVQGDYRVGQQLTHHPAIAKISFTGEVNTGKTVMADAASSLKSVTMELGGKSPLIIFPDADLDNAVSGAMVGNFYTQGEVCTNGTRVFVHENIVDAFIEKLLTRINNNIEIGDPLNPKTNMGALISANHMDKVLGYIEHAKQQGAKCIIGGQRLHPMGNEQGFFISPTVFTECTDDMSIVQDEIFGPVMSILTFKDEKEVVQRANQTHYGLAAGVFTQNIQRAHRIIQQLQAGICWINQYGASPVEMPVGGYKQSGIGRENGTATLEHYTQLKAVYVGMTPMESPF